MLLRSIWKIQSRWRRATAYIQTEELQRTYRHKLVHFFKLLSNLEAHQKVINAKEEIRGLPRSGLMKRKKESIFQVAVNKSSASGLSVC